MDYIRQINAFENWLEYNELGAGPQLLWYKLMAIANKSGWQSELSIANTRLQSMTKTSEKTLINNRNQLIQTGLLQYKKRGRTKAGIYILSDITGNFTVKTTVDCSVDTSVNSSVVSSVDTSAYINKTKQNKTKQSNNASESSITKNSEESAVRYWLNQVNPAEAPFIVQSLGHWVNDFGDDAIVIAAIDEMLKNNARSYKYLEKILKSWESQGLDSLEKVQHFLDGHYNKNNSARNSKSKWTPKKLFDYWWAEKMGGHASLDYFAEKYSVTEQEVGLLTEEIKKQGMEHAIS